MRRVLVVIVAALALAGCGGGVGGAGDSSTKSFPDAQAVADFAGLSSCTPDSEPEIGVADAVDCDEGTVNWFKSSDALNGWAKIAKQVDASGLGGSEVLYGNRWVIECSTAGDCQAAEEALGGKIR